MFKQIKVLLKLNLNNPEIGQPTPVWAPPWRLARTALEGLCVTTNNPHL